MIHIINGETVVWSKHYAEGRLEIWGRCAPEHAQVLDRALHTSVTTRSHIMEAKFFAILAEEGISREVGDAFLAGLYEDDVVILRDPSH